MKRALVLAGGGVAGIAWELGVLRGIRDADPELASRVTGADVVVGTSAGSAVAVQVMSGISLADLYAGQLSEKSAEIEVEVESDALSMRMEAATAGAATIEDMQRAVGAIALDTHTVAESVRRAVVAARLPVSVWPDRILMVTAVDAETGESVVFTRDSDVALVDAVAASCAVPGVWPPVTIDGRRYIDGGVFSSTNAHLADGCDRILVITPSSEDQADSPGELQDEMRMVKPAEVAVIRADAASVAAFGRNPLSPATRSPAARAGRAIGLARAAEVAAFWD